MSSSKELTGGSGDVNPNLWTVVVLQTAIDATTRLTLPVPVIKQCGSCPKGKAYAFELLRIKSGISPGIAIGPIGIVDQSFGLQVRAGSQNPNPTSPQQIYTP